MKLIGTYTSPFVRKISIILHEKNMAFEFVNKSPYKDEGYIAQFNPLGKIPVLISNDDKYWFDSPVIVEYIELLDIEPNMVPYEQKSRLLIKQIESIADGMIDTSITLIRERIRSTAQSEIELLRQRKKITRSLDWCEKCIHDNVINIDIINLATISIVCAISYLNFHNVLSDWHSKRPLLLKLVETYSSRQSFACTKPTKK